MCKSSSLPIIGNGKNSRNHPPLFPPLWPLIEKDKARSDNPGPVETRIRREIILSLKTETLQEAKSRYHHQSSELEDLFQSIRAAYAGFDRVADEHNLKRIAYRYFQNTDLENDQASSQLLANKDDSRDAWKDKRHESHWHSL